MKRLIFMPISLLMIVLIIISLGACGRLLEEGTVVEVSTEEDGAHTSSWKVQVIKSPESGICYEIITNDFSNGFDAVAVDKKFCN